MESPTDHETLRRQYATTANLSARAAIYAYQAPRHDVVARVLAHLAADLRGAVAVDVGCGGGQYAARLGARGADVVCVDLSDGMLRTAVGAGDRPPLGALVGDAVSLPLADDSADAALAMHMLYHLPDPMAGLAELRRVVRPGGTVLVLLNGVSHLDLYRDLLAEAAGATEWLPWPSSTVNLSSEAMFADTFATVTLDRLSGTIVLQRAEPLVAYAASAREFYDQHTDRPWDEVIARFAEAADRRLRREGVLTMSTESGVFVCSVPA